MILLFRGFRFITSQDTSIRHNNFFYRQYHYMRGVRAGVLPTIRSVLLATVSYFRPGFHPTEIGSTAQAVAYLASSPAARNAS